RARVGFARRLVRAVHVRRERLELRGARVDALIHGLQFERVAPVADGRLRRLEREREFLIAEAGALQAAQRVTRLRREPGLLGLLAHLHDLAELPQEPRVDLRALVHLLRRPAAVEGAEDIPHAAVVRDREALVQLAIAFAVGAGNTLRLVAARREQQA